MAEDLFPGPPLPMPPRPTSSGSTWLIRFEPAETEGVDAAEQPPKPVGPVRHATGYAAFAAALGRLGIDPIPLTRDLDALVDTVAEHPELRTVSSQIFFGNALALLNPRAAWRSTPELEVGGDTRSIVVARALAVLIEHPQRRLGFFDSLATWADDDERAAEQQRAVDAAMREQDPTELVPLREPFTPLPLPAPVFRDDAGEVIPFGERWPDRAPDDAYSRVSHPERFAPLHTIADALVAHLDRWCDLTVREETEEGERVVRLEPVSGAPVRFRYTAFPGLIVSAGALWSQPMPRCGCDACDESGAGEVEKLVESVLSIVAGGLTEQYPVGRGRWEVASLRTLDGGSASSSGEPSGTVEQLLAAERTLAALPDGRWPAWPLRPRA